MAIDDMEEFMAEAGRLAEAVQNEDLDEQIRFGKHIAKKANIIADNALKRKSMVGNSKLIPKPRYVGQINNKFKIPMRMRNEPITDRKWADGNNQGYVSERIQSPPEPLLTPEQAASFRHRYRIPDPEGEK